MYCVLQAVLLQPVRKQTLNTDSMKLHYVRIIIIIINDSIYPAVSKLQGQVTRSVVSRMIVQTDESSSAA